MCLKSEYDVTACDRAPLSLAPYVVEITLRRSVWAGTSTEQVFAFTYK